MSSSSETIFYGTSGGSTRFEFTVISNDGGPRHVECSILSMKAAARAAGIKNNDFFRASTLKIRTEISTMFRNMSNIEQLLFANTVADKADSEELDALGTVSMRIRSRVISTIMTRMLPWPAIELYIQRRHPGVANVAQWNFSEGDEQFHLAGLAMDMDPSLPTIHIGHWGFTEHFEALVPLKPELVHIDISGRMTARVYCLDDGLKIATAYMPNACMTVVHAEGTRDCFYLSEEHDLHILLQNHRLRYTQEAYHFHLRPSTRFFDKGETCKLLDAISDAATALWLSTLHIEADQVFGGR